MAKKLIVRFRCDIRMYQSFNALRTTRCAKTMQTFLSTGTVCWKHLLEDNPSYYDSWYFTVVTFTTVGYGDILPVSGSAKLFFMFWCVLSSCIQFTVVSRFLGTVLALAPEPQADLQRDHSGRPLTVCASCMLVPFCLFASRTPLKIYSKSALLDLHEVLKSVVPGSL